MSIRHCDGAETGHPSVAMHGRRRGREPRIRGNDPKHLAIAHEIGGKRVLNKLLPSRGRVPKVNVSVARVAQLDRASVSEAEGCGFDPRPAHHGSPPAWLLLVWLAPVPPSVLPQTPLRQRGPIGSPHPTVLRSGMNPLAKLSGMGGVAPGRVHT